ncbi:class I SAM-dependent methyltransferase [Desulfovibrio aminophilus]|nr:class I SAM-dependent methyltransferase [Desulfovibrio aminophilus]MCM0754515.1 class I SAM-dependent methyltransferase [Desulfovibrio aminophilus]
MSPSTDRCVLCGGAAREVRPGAPFSEFPGVTSDVKPWPRMGAILCCEVCGHVQKRLDAQWRADAEAVYSDYVMYHLSNGSEQVVFDSGGPAPRTSRLIRGMLGPGGVDLPETGDLLDVGCGGGAFLSAFHAARPGWTLAGQDHCAQRRGEVLARDGVRAFHCGGLDEVQGVYDAVSMIYVLEHMPDPVAELARVRRLLKPDGALLVMVPDLAQSFFDFAVVDHCGHFFAETLTRAVEQAGYEVAALGPAWMAKEVGVIARPRSGGPADSGAGDAARGLALASGGLDWLAGAADEAGAEAAALHARGGRFGVFGTAIAGTWLAQVLAGQVDFFVDEDAQRWGKTHLGLPIIGPADAPGDSAVFLGFPPELARNIARRLSGLHPRLSLLVPGAGTD